MSPLPAGAMAALLYTAEWVLFASLAAWSLLYLASLVMTISGQLLYGLRFPHLYGWACNAGGKWPCRGPDPIEVGVSKWWNAYASGDYVGRYEVGYELDRLIALTARRSNGECIGADQRGDMQQPAWLSLDMASENLR